MSGHPKRIEMKIRGFPSPFGWYSWNVHVSDADFWHWWMSEKTKQTKRKSLCQLVQLENGWSSELEKLILNLIAPWSILQSRFFVEDLQICSCKNKKVSGHSGFFDCAFRKVVIAAFIICPLFVHFWLKCFLTWFKPYDNSNTVFRNTNRKDHRESGASGWRRFRFDEFGIHYVRRYVGIFFLEFRR